MPSKVKKDKTNVKGKLVNIGIDIHKTFWQMTWLVEGNVVMDATLARPNHDALKKLLLTQEAKV